MSGLKQRLYEHCQQLLRDKHRHLHERMQALQNSAANETKSTAGDKHETALAMLQLEQEQLRRQLREASEQLAILDRIQPAVKNAQAGAGSLILTDKGTFFIATAIGRIRFEDEPYMVISAASPLGQRLLGTRQNDVITLNNTTYMVLEIG